MVIKQRSSFSFTGYVGDKGFHLCRLGRVADYDVALHQKGANYWVVWVNGAS